MWGDIRECAGPARPSPRTGRPSDGFRDIKVALSEDVGWQRIQTLTYLSNEIGLAIGRAAAPMRCEGYRNAWADGRRSLGPSLAASDDGLLGPCGCPAACQPLHADSGIRLVPPGLHALCNPAPPHRVGRRLIGLSKGCRPDLVEPLSRTCMVCVRAFRDRLLRCVKCGVAKAGSRHLCLRAQWPGTTLPFRDVCADPEVVSIRACLARGCAGRVGGPGIYLKEAPVARFPQARGRPAGSEVH